MKKTYLFLCLVLVLGLSVKTVAQVAPPAGTLTHQWTFDDGTPKDVVGTVDGTLMDGATVQNKALNTVNGGYLQFDGAALALNSYPELTVEVWFTSVKGANTGYHMLTYFGDTDGNNGTNYFCMNPARGGNDNHSRAILHTNGADDWVEGPEFDDGMLHHLVGVVTATTINLYVDGYPMGFKTLNTANFLGNLGTTLAYLGKGGYRADPIWKGSMHKVSIYNAALNDENILYLYNHGAEEQPVLTASTPSMVFDSKYFSEDLFVTGANLMNNITITAPAGITLDVASLPANSVNATVPVHYDGHSIVDGIITISSGALSQEVRVKAVPGSDCFTPLYQGMDNLITPDPGMVSLSNYGGWGTKSVSSIITDPDNVYCGAASIKIGDGINGGSGSLDYPLGSAQLAPNTTYKVRIMAKSHGNFRLATERLDITGLKQTLFNTNGEWQPVELIFTTGETVADNGVLYINDWNLDGTDAYVDNYELYVMPDGYIKTTKESLAFDPEFTTDIFQAGGYNLADNITITAPAGFTVDPVSLSADALNLDVTVTYTGNTPAEGDITLTSGTTTKTVSVKAAASNTTCFTPTADKINLIPDPYFNDKANFKGWENWSIIAIPDTGVYCGSHAGRISGRGDIEVPLPNLMPNYTYTSRVMVLTDSTFHMGINGHDIHFSGDFTSPVNTGGVWQEFVFEFQTGDTLRTTTPPVIFFNNDRENGKLAYLDNWEVVEKGPTATPVVRDLFNNVYLKDGKITADFNLDQATKVQLSVYNMQGSLVSTEKMNAVAGRNFKVVSTVLPSGVYVVKMTYDGKSSFRKLVK